MKIQPPKTEEDFTKAVGREPEEDDMERITCPKEGQPGHWFCGWCEKCDMPRLVCGHARRLILSV